MSVSNPQQKHNSESSNKIVQGLWIGAELSIMEQLSIASFLKHGHEYHLYIYDTPRNIPAGTLVRDANEILPSSSIFQYQQYPSYAGFANFFRYKLLLERGGWWVDSDTVCLKQFDFPEPYVFSSEVCNGIEVINCGAIKVPARSAPMTYAWEVCQSKDPGKLVWGETGPKLMGAAVREYALEPFAKPHHVFCPVGYADWQSVLNPAESTAPTEASYAIHLWNEMWRKVGKDKNANYPDACLYEQLKRRYLGNP